MSPQPALSSAADLDSFRTLAGAHRDAAFLAVEREIRRLQAVQAAMITEVATSGSFRDDADHSARAWVQAVTNSSRRSATTQVRHALLLADLPGLASACSAGRTGADQVQLLAGLHANDCCRAALPESDRLLTGHAAALSFHDFAQVCQRWRAYADPDGAHRDHETSRRNRHASIRRIGAGGILHAEGDALSLDMMSEILEAHAHSELLSDLADRVERFGDAAGRQPLARSQRQRRFDALQTIFRKAAGTGDAGGGRVPLVDICCTPDVLADAIRSFCGLELPPEWSPNGPPRSDRMRRCETASGAPVDPYDLALAPIVGHVRRVVVDSAGRVIDLGRRRRLFTGAARDAVLLAGDCCTHPGCGRRGGFTQVDHVDEWARAGPTSPFNGGIECGSHNRLEHQHGFSVLRDDTGWHHFRPDGTEIAPRDAPLPP